MGEAPKPSAYDGIINAACTFAFPTSPTPPSTFSGSQRCSLYLWPSITYYPVLRSLTWHLLPSSPDDLEAPAPDKLHPYRAPTYAQKQPIAMFRAQSNIFDDVVVKATDENLTSENWEYILVRSSLS